MDNVYLIVGLECKFIVILSANCVVKCLMDAFSVVALMEPVNVLNVSVCYLFIRILVLTFVLSLLIKILS